MLVFSTAQKTNLTQQKKYFNVNVIIPVCYMIPNMFSVNLFL